MAVPFSKSNSIGERISFVVGICSFVALAVFYAGRGWLQRESVDWGQAATEVGHEEGLHYDSELKGNSPIRIDAISPAALGTSQGEPEAGEALAEFVFDVGGLFQRIDLSTWRGVDRLALSLPNVLQDHARVRGIDKTDLAKYLTQARSVRMRQFGLVLIGVLGPSTEDVQLYQHHIEASGLEASCAFALGKARSDEALHPILVGLDEVDNSRAREENLYYGLAQAGAGQVPRLLAASEAWLLLGASAGDAVPLDFVRSQDAFQATSEIATYHAKPVVRVRAINALVSASMAIAFASTKPVDQAIAIAGASQSQQHNRALGSKMLEVFPDGSPWLDGIATNDREPEIVRVAAINALAWLDPPKAFLVAEHLLLNASASDALMQAAFGVLVKNGGADQYVDLLLGLAVDEESTLNAAALRTLVQLASIASDKMIAGLIGDQSFSNRYHVLLHLWMRSDPPSDELRMAVRTLYDASGLDDAAASYALQILMGAAGDSKEGESKAWAAYRDSAQNDGVLALQNVSRTLGARANQELVEAFSGLDEFIPRVCIASALAKVGGNFGRAEISMFFQESVLPFLRTELPASSGAPLAFLRNKGSLTTPEDFGVLLSDSFGRYGTRSDVQLLDNLVASFEMEHGHWPEGLRAATLLALQEAVDRAVDLIHLRLGE